jgi:hypothetical protein
MYITEYYTINKTTKIAIRGVMMYREKRDLAEKRRGKVLAVFVVYRAFPKRIQRRDMWKRLCWKELKHIHVEVSNYYKWGEQFVGLGKSESHVFGFEVRALRRRLGPDQKKLFDQFYYEKKNGYKEKQRMYI